MNDDSLLFAVVGGLTVAGASALVVAVTDDGAPYLSAIAWSLWLLGIVALVIGGIAAVKQLTGITRSAPARAPRKAVQNTVTTVKPLIASLYQHVCSCGDNGPVVNSIARAVASGERHTGKKAEPDPTTFLSAEDRTWFQTWAVDLGIPTDEKDIP